MKRQRIIARNIGKDTHVRNVQGDVFRQQSTKTTQTIMGEVLIAEPEPIFRQNMVSVSLARGGTLTSVAWPGSFIDPVTGNLHGTYEGPIPGQMVVVGFENGNSQAPYVVNRYPYQGKGNTLFESAYINPLTRSLFDSTDVIMGHFSGSYLSFNTGIISGNKPGSVSLNALTDFNLYSNTAVLLEGLLTAELKSTAVTLTGSATVDVEAPAITLTGSATVDIEAPAIAVTSTLGGAVEAGALIAIKSTTQSMKTLIDSLITVISGLVTINCVVGAPVTLNPATIAALAAEKVKWAALLTD